MLKIRFVACAFILAGMAMGGCAPRKPQSLLPDDVSAWKQPPQPVLNYRIPGHENRFRVIYMNDKAITATPVQVGGKTVWDYPEGAVIAKEIYAGNPPAPGEKPLMIDGMVKASSDPRSQSGWIWVIREVSSGKETVFTTNFCSNCHANANISHPYGDKNPLNEGRDSVFFPPLSGAEPDPANVYQY